MHWEIVSISAAATTYLEQYVLAGGVMMWALLPTSLLSLGLALQCFISLRRACLLRRGDLDAYTSLAREGRRADLEALARRRSDTVVGRIVAQVLALEAVPGPDREIDFIRHEIARLFRRVNILAIIYNVAPYMGLLGTVLGLMDTFGRFAASPNPDLGSLSIGLNTAMTTTLWGLGIAVPVYIVFHYFRARLIRYEEDELPRLVRPVMGAMRHAEVELFGNPTPARGTAHTGANQPQAVTPLGGIHHGLSPSEIRQLRPEAPTPSPSQPLETSTSGEHRQVDPLDTSEIPTDLPHDPREIRLP